MKLAELDYELPAERIAQRPLDSRDASRLLVLSRYAGRWRDCWFRELPELVRGDELIVVNNARVFPARLIGRRAGIHAECHGRRTRARRGFLEARIEMLLSRQVEADVWEVLVKPGRKVPVGEMIFFGEDELQAEVTWRGEYGLRRVRLRSSGDLAKTIERLGHVPLPPYIKRADEPADRERYQTVFARHGMAVAAPTAGLHFTPEILEKLRERGAEICEITLEVGLGTFEPIRSKNVEDHRMHREAYEIPEVAAGAIERARRERRPILAVGTTVVRALEDSAEKCAAQGQTASSQGGVRPGRDEAQIFLYPGRSFRIVEQLLTNFHLPRSSLLALVCAFAGGDPVLEAYRHAVRAGYRFYSYGDCMLIR